MEALYRVQSNLINNIEKAQVNFKKSPKTRLTETYVEARNSKIDEVQKLHYLKTHISGEAEQLLRHIPVTSQNYQMCWDQLDRRYNNKRYLADGILKRFMSQRNVTTESASSLKELLDTSNECLCALDNLGINTEHWNVIVIYILCLKLDTESRKLWEVRLSDSSEDIPTFKNFKEFLEQRFRSLEFLENKNSKGSRSHTVKNLHVVNNKIQSCGFCQDNHKLANCKKFAQESVESRREFVKNQRLCFGCLHSNHSVFACRLPIKCKICNKRHHSLLHPTGAETREGHLKSQALAQSSSTVEPKEVKLSNIVTCFSNIHCQVLLATALVKVQVRNNYSIIVRALLDQGSQASFITEATVQLLKLNKIYTESNVIGLGGDQQGSVVSKAVVLLKLQSLQDPSYNITVKAHVLKRLTSFLPEKQVVLQAWEELSKLKLADPLFHAPNKIDILLGADVYGQVLINGILKGPPGYPMAQNTTLGWIVSGQVGNSNISSSQTCCTSIISMHTEISERDLLQKFWEIEAEPKENKKRLLTEEEIKCEEMFKNTTKRDENGRYIVKLPFKSSNPPCKYGNSKEIALKRFDMLEKRLSKNKKLQKEYSNVIQDYLDLGHLEVVPNNEEDEPEAVYLPHHCVIREEKDTTKVRVVYDASCRDKNGESLNSNLMIGPTLQDDLRTLIMRWRGNPICLVADIEKMYRQVKVSKEDNL
ncbi:uncharacterized protein LOC128198927 [Bicyclus anynana]|uniref:Uncharacterized protein LOC128198927 n=1 Tax=Bicyclus anynana TaxID=110368 RepID=A0ABM3LUE6_BICAN|nr:uncharacterized protein LOC128198927 [Bicyclus anynana]